MDYRTTSKLLTTYIDKLPECINPKTGKIHCGINQYGAKTGRLSSDNPNLQNIPSHNKDIRKMFVAENRQYLVTTNSNKYVVNKFSEVETSEGWKFADKLKTGDYLILDNSDETDIVEKINILSDTVEIICY